jgi:hypothetical protein
MKIRVIFDVLILFEQKTFLLWLRWEISTDIALLICEFCRNLLRPKNIYFYIFTYFGQIKRTISVRKRTKCTIPTNTSNQTYPRVIPLFINRPYLIWNHKRYKGTFSEFPSLIIGNTGHLWSGFLFASRTTFNTHEKITDKNHAQLKMTCQSNEDLLICSILTI